MHSAYISGPLTLIYSQLPYFLPWHMVKYICPRGITLDSHLFAFSPIIIHVLVCCHVLIVHMLNDPDRTAGPGIGRQRDPQGLKHTSSTVNTGSVVVLIDLVCCQGNTTQSPSNVSSTSYTEDHIDEIGRRHRHILSFVNTNINHQPTEASGFAFVSSCFNSVI